MKAPDFGKTAADYAAHRAGFPPELFERLAEHSVGVAGQKLIDVGTGTGALAREFARTGCEVTGLDPSQELMDQARRLDVEAKLSVSYVRGVAEDTGLPDSSFDAAAAGVCWHWFDGNRAAREILRILAPGGRLAIVHFDWLATPGSVAADSVDLIESLLPRTPGKSLARAAFFSVVRRLKPEWVEAEGSGVHPDRFAVLARAGFEELKSFSFDVPVEYSHQAWRGRLRSHALLGASKPAKLVKQVDQSLAAMLRERHPDDPFTVMHRVFVVLGRKASRS